MKTNRGGIREGAGRKPSGNQSVVVRVPVELLPMIESAKLGISSSNIQASTDAELIAELRRRGLLDLLDLVKAKVVAVKAKVVAVTKDLKAKGIIKATVRRLEEYSNASYFVTIAISEMERIEDNDPRRIEQLDRVLDYISSEVSRKIK